MRKKDNRNWSKTEWLSSDLGIQRAKPINPIEDLIGGKIRFVRRKT